MQDTSKKAKPKFLFLIEAFLCGVFAVGYFCYYLFNGITGLTDDLVYLQMPGREKVVLAEPGTYTVFYEHTYKFDKGLEPGTNSDAEAILLIVSSPDGENVPTYRPSGNMTYNLGDKSGYSLYQFEAPADGEYQISGSYNTDNDRVVMFCLAHDFTKRLLMVILGSFLALGLPGILAVILLILGLKPLFDQNRQQSSADQ